MGCDSLGSNDPFGGLQYQMKKQNKPRQLGPLTQTTQLLSARERLGTCILCRIIGDVQFCDLRNG
ncbi:hypothetical protein STEG23_015373, partial [Scotinomys teguina]